MTRKPIEVIQTLLDHPELLCQLAEEASELSQAALKLRRALTGTNPTPKTVQECYDELVEEIGDVSNALTALGYDKSLTRMRTLLVAQEKMERWAERLEQREIKEGHTEVKA